MKNAGLLLVAVPIAAVVAFAGWRYLSGPRDVAKKWLGCNGTENRSLVTAADRQYWDEAYPPSRWEQLRPRLDACLGVATIEDISVHGRSGEVKFTARGPQLTWQQMTEFPATSTPAERVAIVRERASHVQPGEFPGTLKVRFEGLRWLVQLNLEDAVLIARDVHHAEDLEKSGDDQGAMAVYDRLAARSDLDSIQRRSMGERRLDVLAKKACRAAARQYLKYAESAEFDLTGLASIAKGRTVGVVGTVLSPNAFGVKQQLQVSCDVIFSVDKPTASVKLFMFPSDGTGSMVSEDHVLVRL